MTANAPLQAAGALVGLTWMVGCAHKDLLQVDSATPRHLSLALKTTTGSLQLSGPAWLWVGAAYDNGDGVNLLNGKFSPLVQGTQQVQLDVDLGPCLAYNSRKGKDGCPLYLAAGVFADTMAFADSTRSFLGEAYDSALPLGPFDVAPGRTPTVPIIDLSTSRFAAVQWTADDGLRVGGRDVPVEGISGTVAEMTPISGVANDAGTPTLYTVTTGPAFTYNNDPQQGGLKSQLAIFENGTWRRVSGPDAVPGPPFQAGVREFTGVTALSAREVYMSATDGMYAYDGSAIKPVAGVSGTLIAINSRVVGANKYVIAGGYSGTVWIGNTQTWQKYTLPENVPVFEVCIVGPTEAYAASTGTNNVYRFDGTTWTPIPTPVAGGNWGLQCPAAGQVFVGKQSASGNRALWRLVGNTWTALPTNGVANTRALHWAVVSPTEIYAWGDSATVDRAFVKFDGTTWTTIGRSRYTNYSSRPWAPPTGGAAYFQGYSSRLERVSASANTVLSYQPSLRDVAVNSATSTFVVGTQSFFARYNGTQWTVDAPPANSSTLRTMTGVWSDGPTNAWAVGNQSTVARWNGTSWLTASDSVRPVAARDDYNGVWGVGADVWAVGEKSILHCTSPTTCVNEGAGGGALLSVWGSSATNVFAVGEGGRILRYNGTAWTAMSSPTSRTLSRVSGSNASTVYAIGDSVLLRYDGTQWTSIPMTGALSSIQTPVPSAANRSNGASINIGLWVRGPREVYAAGQYASLVRYDGTGWVEIFTQRYAHGITAIHGNAASGCVLAVTEAQTINNAPTLLRGSGPTGCFGSPMGVPTVWP